MKGDKLREGRFREGKYRKEIRKGDRMKSESSKKDSDRDDRQIEDTITGNHKTLFQLLLAKNIQELELVSQSNLCQMSPKYLILMIQRSTFLLSNTWESANKTKPFRDSRTQKSSLPLTIGKTTKKKTRTILKFLTILESTALRRKRQFRSS